MRLGKWLTLNLGKSGVSVSVGVPGARVTLSPEHVQTTVGVPGTGASWSDRTSLANSGDAGKRSRRDSE